MASSSSRDLRRAIVCLVPSIILPLLVAVGSPASDYRFVSIADQSTVAPFGSFLNFDRIAASEEKVVFVARYSGGPGSYGQGIFLGGGGPIATIVKSGDAAPAGTFVDFQADPAIDGPAVSFQAVFDNGNGGGIFASDGNSWTLVARTGDVTSVGTLLGLTNPLIGDETVVFSASYDPSGNSYGLFRSDSGVISPIVKEGDPAPVGTFGGHYVEASFDGTSVATVLGYENASGIFVHNNPYIAYLTQSGDPAPIGIFQSIGKPIHDGQFVAFPGDYQDPGSSLGLEQGIFVADIYAETLTTIAKMGDATAIGALDPYLRAMKPVSVANGSILFEATGDLGSAIFSAEVTGGPLATVIKIGDSLFGSQVIDLHAGRSNDGLAPFVYTLADGRYGVALAVPVPEPATGSLVAFILSLAMLRRRQT